MDYITSKTHRYIAVRVYPSDYILEKFYKREPKALRQFNAYRQTYYKFYKELFEFITDEPYDEFGEKYPLCVIDSSKEEIYEHTGIFIANSGPNEVFCIPRKPENDRIYDYVIENIPCKFKVLKRTRGTYMDHGVSTFHRDMGRELARNLKDKIVK